MELRGSLLLIAAMLGLLTASTSAQATNHWRYFTTADGLAQSACLSITPGPNGDVLLRHPDTNTISLFDGFNATQIPGPDEGRRRVFESPGGQLWTVTSRGLFEFHDGNWTLVAVTPVAEHLRARRTEEILLLPVRQGRVLILLPDELLQITVESSGNANAENLVRADAIALGVFTNMFAGRGGALLLAGRTGFARSQQPFRALTPEARWEVSTNLPADFPEPSLARLIPPGNLQVLDRVQSPGEVVWLSTPNHLARYTPPLWSLRASLSAPEMAVQDFSPADRVTIEAARELGNWNVIFKTRTGDLWFGGESKVAWARGESIRVFASTNQIGPEQVQAFAESHDGRIVCATPAKIWEFDGQNWFTLRSGFDQANSLLSTRNGTLWVAARDGVHRLFRDAWVRNDFADGLPATGATNLVETLTGEIIARCIEGDWKLNPAADTEPPRVIIPPLTDNRTRIREGDALRLGFTGRDRWDVTAPERLLYSYKLDERQWSAFEETAEAFYADLPAGRHLFLVRVMDRNANVSPPATLEFIVVLPWYRETRLVFILAIALIVALALAGLAYNRHRKLQVSYASVERLVAERTRELELAQRELVHSQKMNALGTLSAGIAHDFNNILSIIKGSAQIIEDNPGNEEKIRTRVDRIKTVVQQGAGIVEAMLGFSRQSAGSISPADVNHIVDDTLKLLGDRFLRGVEVRFDRGMDLPEIPVVRDFVQQALLNFIFNAAEAMERRAPAQRDAGTRNQIRLHTELVNAPPLGLFLKPAPAEKFIQISVRDTGEGITPENLPRIFEPFFTTKSMSSQRGTGLGLSMVYELARKLEAGLAVESEPGKGSTFTLILPVKAP